MMVLASDLKPGVIVRQEGELWQVLAADFHMGGGKSGGMEHAKLKNLATGTVSERRFRPDQKLESVEAEKRRLTYLYQDGEFYVFMNPETYDQIPLHENQLGRLIPFLKEDLEVTALFHDETLIALQVPEFVDLAVVASPPPIHEQETTTSKRVTLENGMEILVPQFIKQGDTVRVQVETGRYLERV